VFSSPPSVSPADTQLFKPLSYTEETVTSGLLYSPRLGPLPGWVFSSIEILAHVTDQLADYKVPESLQILDQIPRNATGKIDRQLSLKIRTDCSITGSDCWLTGKKRTLGKNLGVTAITLFSLP
jgi:hypothetical protein